MYTSTGSLQKMNLGSVITQSTIGVALIVSNDYITTPERDLPETRTDAQKMKKFLTKCKYKVFRYHNLDKKSFVTLYEEMARHQYPKTCRRLIVYFSGHGGDGTIRFQDRGDVIINDMVNSFKPVKPNNSKNESLGNTVRMFFIDACRGNQKDYGYSSSKDLTTTIKHNSKFLDKDSANDTNILVAYATTPQHICYGEVKEAKGNGSLWTYYLLKELENSHEDILIQLRNINDALKDTKIHGKRYQIGQVIFTLAEDVNFKREAGLDLQDKTEHTGLDQNENTGRDQYGKTNIQLCIS